MSVADNDYICPNCKGHLNVGNYVVFATQTHQKHKGLLMMSPIVGEYKYKHHDKFHLEAGERLDFECPICQADLTSNKSNELAMINMVGEEDHAEYELYFSKIVGKQSTYVVTKDTVKTFGTDAQEYDEFFYD